MIASVYKSPLQSSYACVCNEKNVEEGVEDLTYTCYLPCPVFLLSAILLSVGLATFLLLVYYSYLWAEACHLSQSRRIESLYCELAHLMKKKRPFGDFLVALHQLFTNTETMSRDHVMSSHILHPTSSNGSTAINLRTAQCAPYTRTWVVTRMPFVVLLAVWAAPSASLVPPGNHSLLWLHSGPTMGCHSSQNLDEERGKGEEGESEGGGGGRKEGADGEGRGVNLKQPTQLLVIHSSATAMNIYSQDHMTINSIPPPTV